MHWIDWTVALLPLALVLVLAVWARSHIRDVADFLTGGRVAGRYLLAVSGMEASQGIFGLLAVYEANYQSGFAYSFWSALNTPVLIIIALTGYGAYRFRETRAMTMGQFLEMRYSRRFRTFAGCLQSLSGILNYGLFPAVSGRFFVYFCGLPTEVSLMGAPVPTYVLLMAGYLALAATVAISGGQLAIMVADTVVGILSYPMYLCLVGYIVWRFSWFHDLAPALLDRPAGHSLLNPFDIQELREFNLFYVLVGIVSGIVNRLSWSGNQGFFSAGKTAHEQKMCGVLQTWRTGFSMMMYVLVPVVALAFFKSNAYNAGPTGSDAARTELASKVTQDVLPGERYKQAREQVHSFVNTGIVPTDLRGTITAGDNVVENRNRIGLAQDAIRSANPSSAQSFATIYRQMSVPMALRHILPTGLIGIFCAICISLLFSTDASYQHSWASIIVQDIIVPLRGNMMSPRAHLRLLRLMIIGVAGFAFCFSLFFGQIDYILMFQAITGAIWMAGSGPCIMGGLYWNRGTTAAAWCTLIMGAGIAIASILAQQFWAGLIYPWLFHHGWTESVGRMLQAASSPFEPYIVWRMGPDRFPINSQELFFISILVSVSIYVVVSLLTCRERFNMDRLLHRGQYRRADEPATPREPLTARNAFSQLIGIDSQYTRGDKVIAWSVFIWSFGWLFGVCFVVVAVWNLFSRWDNHAWSVWFYINNFIIAGVIGLVSTVWFTIGGTRDLYRLFQDLRLKKSNPLDDGRVIGHVSAADLP